MYPLHAIPIARPNAGQALLPISYTQVKSPDSKRETVENGECKDNRYRCPALEAGIQVFFRILTILLHIGTLVAVVIAKESSHVDIRFYCGVVSPQVSTLDITLTDSSSASTSSCVYGKSSPLVTHPSLSVYSSVVLFHDCLPFTSRLRNPSPSLWLSGQLNSL